MALIELQFPILGERLATQHGYAIYAAVSRVVPDVHRPDFPVQIGPVAGEPADRGELRLLPRRSRLRFRIPAEHVPVLLPLAGKSLEIDGYRVRVGVPTVLRLIPAPNLIARLVVLKSSSPKDANGNRDPELTKRYLDPTGFLEAVRRELVRLDISGQADLPLVTTGAYAGQQRRRVLRIKERRIIGFSVQVTGLTAEESVRLQEAGLGGRRKMGCGFFVPLW